MKKFGMICLSLCLSTALFAEDQAAKEDLTPPAAAGALTAEQIPPLYSTPKANGSN